MEERHVGTGQVTDVASSDSVLQVTLGMTTSEPAGTVSVPVTRDLKVICVGSSLQRHL